MPTYEYECKGCGHSFEKLQSMSDAPLEACPKCRKELRRLIGGGAGIIFKGPGFYATDYRKPAQSAPAACSAGQPSACASCPHSAK